MPITFAEEDCAPTCSASVWTVLDRSLLVQALAWLYLRKPSHAVRILQETMTGPASFPGNEFTCAQRMLSYKTDDIEDDLKSNDKEIRRSAQVIKQKRIEQRDGLLFQHISWVAAKLKFPEAHLSPPHARKADKGFDGVMVQIGTAGAVSKVIMCEDKATTNPKPLIQRSVWDEVVVIDSGNRDDEVLDAVTTILACNAIDADQVLKDVAWDKVRQFRVAVTAPDNIAQNGKFGHIFDGFDKKAPSCPDGRYGEVMSLSDVRGFLDQLAEEVKQEIAAREVALGV